MNLSQQVLEKLKNADECKAGDVYKHGEGKVKVKETKGDKAKVVKLDKDGKEMSGDNSTYEVAISELS